MKRGGPIQRHTPLRGSARGRHTPERPPAPPLDFAAAGRALAHQSAPAPAFTGPVPEVSKPTPKVNPRGFPPVVRQTIIDRDHMACVRCGRPMDGSHGYSLQHRDNRGMGGTRDFRINLPSNGIVLCGSATTPGGCHEWAESNEEEAARGGYVVRSWADPTTVPVLMFTGRWVLLTNNGTAWLTSEPEGGDAHAVARRKDSLR